MKVELSKIFSLSAPGRTGRANANPDGFTLIESLIAILVVSILLVGISPMIALSVAARVQARRVDLATQAALGYINGVNSGVITPPTQFASVPAQTTTNSYNLDAVVAPTTAITDIATKIDTDGNGFSYTSPQDLVIQPIRTLARNSDGTFMSASTAEVTAAASQGFDLVVRVYRADAFSSSGTPNVTLLRGSIDGCQNLTFVGTTGAKACPLVVLKSAAGAPITTPGQAFLEYQQKTCRGTSC